MGASTHDPDPDELDAAWGEEGKPPEADAPHQPDSKKTKGTQAPTTSSRPTRPAPRVSKTSSDKFEKVAPPPPSESQDLPVEARPTLPVEDPQRFDQPDDEG